MLIIHGIYDDFLYFRNSMKTLFVPDQFFRLIKKRWNKMNKNKEYYEEKDLEFTLGIDGKYAVIAIVSQKDNFNRKIGAAIVNTIKSVQNGFT